MGDIKKDWDKDIEKLEDYFVSIRLPKEPIWLNRHSLIADCSVFVPNHLEVVKSNNGRIAYLPYLNRLKKIKEVLMKLNEGKNV